MSPQEIEEELSKLRATVRETLSELQVKRKCIDEQYTKIAYQETIIAALVRQIRAEV